MSEPQQSKISLEVWTERLLEADDEGFLVQCACGHEGPCGACGGTKKARLLRSVARDVLPEQLRENPDLHIDLLKCGPCEGSGKVVGESSSADPQGMAGFALDYMKGKDCPVCNGVGVLVRCFPRLACKQCEETGFTVSCGVTTCYSCYGAGSLYKGTVDLFGENG